MQSHDVIVIGAGSVGLPCAFYLAEEGLRVAVLEKNSSVGQGENKAAIGGARATHSNPAKIRLCQESLDAFSTWRESHGDDVGWKGGGYCFPVYREEEEKTLKDILPLQKKYDLDIDWVGPNRIKDIIPGINPAGLRGGTYSPGDGQVSPLMVASSYQRLCEARGVKFFFEEEVTGIVINSGRITAVRTGKETYPCQVVVNAAGPYAREVGLMCGLDIPVVPDSHEAGISAPVEQFLQPLVVDLRPGPAGKSSNFYFGQNSEGRFIFCYTPAEILVGTDKRSTSEFASVIGRRLIELIPRLRNLLIRRCWRGLYPMTPDGVPILGKPSEPEGLVLAAGTCGQGFMMGPGVGRNIAKLIATGRPLMEQDIFDTMSFHRDFTSGKAEALR
ncbi:MAG: FAD-binding oxidoreductase [Candidatus Eiseniibacteriota bacterium]|nr:MAG: FAD-binding oxidoreductase [Candidatus Eisenbacteria bacterium]